MDLFRSITIINKNSKSYLGNQNVNFTEILNLSNTEQVLMTQLNSLKDDTKNCKQANLQEDKFLESQSQRIARIEANNQHIENVVKDCLRWKHRLNSLIDSNRILKEERKLLMDNYEELLRKTKKDADIIFLLQDSENRLNQEIERNAQVERVIQTSEFIDDKLTIDRENLKNEKCMMIRNLNAKNSILVRINNEYKKYAYNIENQKEYNEGNINWYEEILKKLDFLLNILQGKQIEFMKILSKRAETSKNIKKIAYGSLMKTAENGKEDYGEKLNEETNEINAINDNIPTNTNNLETNIFIDDTNKEYEALDSLQKYKYLLQITQKQNRHLQDLYYLFNGRISMLHDKIIHLKQSVNFEEKVFKKLKIKSKDVEKCIRKNKDDYEIFLRGAVEELNIKIENQSNKNLALKDLLSLCFSLQVQDTSLQEKFHVEIEETSVSGCSDQSYTDEQSKQS